MLFALIPLILDALFSRRITPVISPATRPPVEDDDYTDPVSPVPPALPAAEEPPAVPRAIEAPAIVPPSSLDFGAATPVARALLAAGHHVFQDNSKPYNLNLVGIRDASPEWDKFGCQFVQFWKDERGEWRVKAFAFTTFPGDYYSRVKFLNPAGVLIMAEGQYRSTFRIRKHRGLYDALCQDLGKVRVFRDGDRDRVYDLDPRTIQTGSFAANLHAPENPDDGISRQIYESIGKASAGCQVFARPGNFIEARKEWYEASKLWGDAFTYTLINARALGGSLEGEGVSVAPPVIVVPSDYTAGRLIVNLEARRDDNGDLAIYPLPKNDGGGTAEVAGINNGYHPAAFRDLVNLPASAREEYAARYIEDYAVRGTKLDQISVRPGTRFFVLDSAFNRGPGGAAWIVQRALRSLGMKVDHDGKWGEQTRGALELADAKNSSMIVARLRIAREAYEREEVGYRANLWDGLVFRWNNAEKIATRLNDGIKA